jgi:hypothetical protein
MGITHRRHCGHIFKPGNLNPGKADDEGLFGVHHDRNPSRVGLDQKNAFQRLLSYWHSKGKEKQLRTYIKTGKQTE